MKDLAYLIIHSTESPENSPLSKEDIIEKHTKSLALGGYGWNRPGLDYLIQLDGSLQVLINEQSPTTVDLWGISKGAEGILVQAKHIAYVGGRTKKGAWAKDSRTDAQKKSLANIVKFYTLRFPTIVIAGFDELPAINTEDNPAFNVAQWLQEIGISEKHIFNKKALTTS